MYQKKNAEIDFDRWAEIARTDPETFEAMRLEAIASAPEDNRERLRCLQWRIDQERRLARTPMAACVRISRLMWRSLLGPNGLQDRFVELQRLAGGGAADCGTDGHPLHGEIVAFRRAAD